MRAISIYWNPSFYEKILRVHLISQFFCKVLLLTHISELVKRYKGGAMLFKEQRVPILKT